ncbi:MAG: hypothetical protein FWE34_02395 [Defluviitaleaceae bacterium]|nr:hypothetical protein [Defluviitaleaceae bacterium]
MLETLARYLSRLATGLIDHLLQIAIGAFIIIVLGRLFISLPAWRLGLRGAIRQNGYMHYLSGYYMFASGDDLNIYIIADGVWGINATHLVFLHRSAPDKLDVAIEISEVQNMEIFHYDISECIFAENNDADVIVHGIDNALETPKPMRAEFVIEEKLTNAMKKPMVKSTLEMKANELVCRITLADGAESFFYYKDTHRNADAIKEITEIFRRDGL